MNSTAIEGVLKLVDDGERDLLIVFAHRDAEHFAFQTVTRPLPCAKLFVRDPSLRGWYNNGLPGLGETVEEIAEALRRRLNLERYQRIAVLGSSMGGYAAVLFGALLGADKVLAFNPQTTLNRLFPLAPPKEYDLQCPDLGPVVERTRKTRFDVVISEDDAVDLCHAAHLVGMPGVRVSTVLGASHLLTDELNRRGELSLLLEAWLGDQALEILAPVPIAASTTKAAQLEGGVLAFLSQDYRQADLLLRDLWREQPSHAGLSLFAGLAAAADGQHRFAVPALRNTLRYRPQWEHAQEQLRRSLLERGFMIEQHEHVPERPCREFKGVGQDINAAVLDAILSANRHTNGSFGTSAEVAAWGVDAIGIGGARSFWARIRKPGPSTGHT